MILRAQHRGRDVDLDSALLPAHGAVLTDREVSVLAGSVGRDAEVSAWREARLASWRAARAVARG